MNPVLERMFEGVGDPRIDRTKHHPLISILYIAFCSIISGGDSFTAMEDYGEIHEDQLKKIIDLPHGVPTHDTFRRVLSALDAEVFQSKFCDWTAMFIEISKDVICIDGKTLRRSHNHNKNVPAIHLLSAWAHEARITLAQRKVDSKTNEISVVPELIEDLDIKGQIVTMDAMGCQRDICEQILQKEGDYVISLKGNQGALRDDVKTWFDNLPNQDAVQVFEEIDKGHGRIERRICHAIDNIDWLKKEHDWPGLASIAMMHSSRTIKGETTSETRYFVTSLAADAKKIAYAIRAHWSIENSLHWVLDVSCNEDSSRIRSENAPEIMALIRRWTLNILNQHKGKLSIKQMQRRCFVNPAFLINVIQKLDA